MKARLELRPRLVQVVVVRHVCCSYWGWDRGHCHGAAMGHAVLLRAGRTRDCGSCGSGCGGGVQRCRLQGGDQCAHQHSSALLCTEILTLSLTLQHAANITQHGRHHGHGATQTHNTCQHNTTRGHVWARRSGYLQTSSWWCRSWGPPGPGPGRRCPPCGPSRGSPSWRGSWGS